MFKPRTGFLSKLAAQGYIYSRSLPPRRLAFAKLFYTLRLFNFCPALATPRWNFFILMNVALPLRFGTPTGFPHGRNKRKCRWVPLF